MPKRWAEKTDEEKSVARAASARSRAKHRERRNREARERHAADPGAYRAKRRAQYAARVQKKYKRLARGRKIVDELLAERREEARRE